MKLELCSPTERYHQSHFTILNPPVSLLNHHFPMVSIVSRGAPPVPNSAVCVPSHRAQILGLWKWMCSCQPSVKACGSASDIRFSAVV